MNNINHKQKRILFVSHESSRTGAPLVLLNLVRWIKSNTDLSFGILLKEDGELADDFRILGPTWIFSKKAKKRDILGRILSKFYTSALYNSIKNFILLKRIRPKSYDLVYSNTFANGEILHFLNHTNVLSHVHELSNTIYQLGNANLSWVKEYTLKYIAVSEVVKQELIDNFSINSNQIVVQNPFFVPVKIPTISEDDLRKALNINQDYRVIGGAGNTDWRKGSDLFVQLAGVLSRNYKSEKLFFIWVGQTGSGLEQNFKNLQYDLKKLGIEATFHFTGMIPNPQDYFRLFDVFVLTSREDPYPLVVLENASLKKPIVCFDGSGGIPEFIEEDAGFIIPYLDLTKATERIIDILESNNLRDRLGNAAFKKLYERHEFNHSCNKLFEVIKTMI